MTARSFGWFDIARIGLVQASLGSIVVLTTSTMNRIMVVELALPAILPGALVGLHYAVQLLRPVWGHGSDGAARRTPWIIAGMAVLALGGVGAAAATALMGQHLLAGIAAAVVAFTVIGLGVGAAGTSALALLAARSDEDKRAGAATVVWLMMIAGIVVTAISAGSFLDPYTPQRLVEVTSAVGAIALLVTIIALWRIEGDGAPVARTSQPRQAAGFTGMRAALSEVWAEAEARRFTIFVFVSMLAYSAQDLILEPFAGAIFGFTPGETTKLSGTQHGGVFTGMLLVGLVGTIAARGKFGALRRWSMVGCIASAFALLGLAFGAVSGPPWPLSLNVFALGVSNGAFAVAAIASMMELAKKGRVHSEGVRMGVWGAAQGVAFGLGGFLGTVASDLAHALIGSSALAYATVFGAEALLFLASAYLATQIARASRAVELRPSSAGFGAIPQA